MYTTCAALNRATVAEELPDVLSSAGILASRGAAGQGQSAPSSSCLLDPSLQSLLAVSPYTCSNLSGPQRAPAYSTFCLRSHCVKRCLPGALASFGVYLNTLLTCRNVPGSHSAFLCRVKGHTLTLCARRRGSLGMRLGRKA